jgi:hypothetical protein
MLKKLNAVRAALPAAAVAATLVLASPQALAVATGTLQFTSFSYTTSGGTLVWSDADVYQESFVRAWEAGGFAGDEIDWRVTEDWSPGRVEVSTMSASASVDVMDGPALALMASATPNYAGGLFSPHKADANSYLERSFSLTAPGSVTFVVDYVIDVSANPDNPFEYATALAQLQFVFFNDTFDSEQAKLDTHDYAGGVGHASGSLSMTLNLGAAEDGIISLYADTYAQAPPAAAAPVPEPGTLALWLAGLGGVAFLWRRQRPALG